MKVAMMLPTKTAVIDVGRYCQARCDFCYYHHNTDYQGFVDYEVLCSQVDQAKFRGNTFIDLTGGEPTMMPGIEKYLAYIHDAEMKMCVITNGLCNEAKQDNLFPLADLWRFSMHGKEDTHDEITHFKGARKKQIAFINRLINSAYFNIDLGFHVNYVLVKATQHDLVDFGKWIATYPVKQFNVINFLPHFEWAEMDKAKKMVADLHEAEKQLNEVIPFLEEKGIGVNVRYYPMCAIDMNLRRVVCNDLQVMFDPWEWDYSAYPKTRENYLNYGKGLSDSIEEKGAPCCNCSIHQVCGGINKRYNMAIQGEGLMPCDGEKISFNPYYYRQHNLMTLTNFRF